MFCGSAEYSAEPLEKFAEYSVSAESHFGWFGRGSVSAEFHFNRFGKDSVWPNLILAGSVHHYEKARKIRSNNNNNNNDSNTDNSNFKSQKRDACA